MATTKLPAIVVESLYQEDEAPHRFKVEKPVEVILSNGDFLYIPAGYITDFGSIPRLLWAIIIPIGKHNLATLIHDFLITDTSYPREYADQEMLYWLKQRKVSKLKCFVMHKAVSLYTFYLSIRGKLR